MNPQRVTLDHMTETLTIQNPGTDEQRLDLYPDGALVAIEVTDQDDTCIELRLSKPEAERLLAKLAITIARL